ncbi:LuxR family transcriptional regulator [Pseudarthrobacter sp. PS3-L1]|uniref:helix-turn-helix transcriptional regulator n=1 Tax=Pseudarthrobacter sp. PS3-L1 TaxID=3046207 RepID=UPI0024B9C3E8|nr:LuxR family transcriptional regulator [Pseudarthrobacter sp. PS3-L1]MDJ0319664.1 LuxR C-terminal-related transcriptional regulator [Pseudarthrobacter sp. PS3-L1]
MSAEPLEGDSGLPPAMAMPLTVSGVEADHRQWSVSARSEDLRAIGTALTSDNVFGVVLTGEYGAGKAAIARTAVTDLGPGVYSVRLRSHPALSNEPYASISALLARLPVEAGATPVALLQGVMDLIRHDAAGRDCVLVLEDGGLLDPLSAAVLVNLMVTGTARVLLTVTESALLPGDFHRFLAAGELVEIRLTGLGERQVRQVLLSLLGHRISAGATRIFHRLSGGNSLLLRGIVTEQQQQGNLVLSSGTWTLRKAVDLSVGPIVQEMIQTRWAGENENARLALDLLVCARSVPLNVLSDLFGPDTIAGLEDRRRIHVESLDRVRLVPQDEGLHSALLSMIGVNRQRELHNLLSAAHPTDPALMSDEELMAHAAWALESLGAIDGDLALGASRAALDAGDPASALGYAGAIGAEQPQWVSAQRLIAAAHVLSRSPEDALSALDAVPQQTWQDVGSVEYALLVEQKCRALCAMRGYEADIAAQIHEARYHLRSRTGTSGGGTTAIEHLECSQAGPAADAGLDLLDIVEFEFRAFGGDFWGMVVPLEDAFARLDSALPSFRVRVGSLLMLAYAVCGREDDAQRVLQDVGGLLGAVVGAVRRRTFQERAFIVHLLCGKWRSGLEVVREAEDGSAWSQPQRGAVMELMEGTAYVFAGRGAAGLDALRSAVATLQLGPYTELVRLGVAATALAYAQMGQPEESREHAGRLDAQPPGEPFILTSLTDFCRLSARRWLDEPDASSLLDAMAFENSLQGRHTLAGFFLLGATVRGTGEQYVRLAATADRRQGLLAGISRHIAVGSQTQNPTMLLAGAAAAQKLELDALEAHCVALALEIARSSGDAAAAREAQMRLDRLSGTLAALPLVPVASPLLTSRERQVANLAGRGASNRDIAQRMGVSVRTVEGHLYQIFTKLGVTSRGDLPGSG